MKEIEKPLLIIAGAGSGKTLTVASKIAYLIEKGVKTENILALAFNEKAASESYDELCWECWDDQLTEESDSMFDELM